MSNLSPSFLALPLTPQALWPSPPIYGQRQLHCTASQALNFSHSFFSLLFLTHSQLTTQPSMSPSFCHSNPSPITCCPCSGFLFPPPTARVDLPLLEATGLKSEIASCMIKPILCSMQQYLTDFAQRLLLFGCALHLWTTEVSLHGCSGNLSQVKGTHQFIGLVPFLVASFSVSPSTSSTSACCTSGFPGQD